MGDSASLRLAWILALARRLGYEVVLYSIREQSWFGVDGNGVEDFSLVPLTHNHEVTPCTIAWVAQPQAAAVVMPILANESLRVIYDSVDLHHLRLQREAAVTGSRGRRLQARLMRELERRVVSIAGVTVAISEDEVASLSELGAAHVPVLPNIHRPRSDPPPPLSARRGLLFVGNYTHSPNVDAVEVLALEVMPRIWKRHPMVELSIVGRAFPSHHFPALDARIAVLGWVPDLDAIVDTSSVLVAPLRFGAGLKGKIGYAMARGLPVVTTTMGAEGFMELGGMAVCDVGDWEGFAERVLELLEHENRWAARSQAGMELIRNRFSEDVLQPTLASILEAA